MTPERIAAVADRMEGGDAVKECVRALGAADLLGVGWPKEYGGRGFTALEQFIFFEEAQRVNAPIPLVTLNTVGPTLDALRHRGAEAEVSAGDPGRHRRVRDRLLRAVGGKRSGVAAHHRGARRRRLHHQRPEDVHQRRGVRRLHLARRAHRSQRSRSTRASRSSSCRRRRPDSPGSRCTPCRASPPSTPSTTTCGCRPALDRGR